MAIYKAEARVLEHKSGAEGSLVTERGQLDLAGRDISDLVLDGFLGDKNHMESKHRLLLYNLILLIRSVHVEGPRQQLVPGLSVVLVTTEEALCIESNDFLKAYHKDIRFVFDTVWKTPGLQVKIFEGRGTAYVVRSHCNLDGIMGTELVLHII